MTDAIWAVAWALEELGINGRGTGASSRADSASPAMAMWSDLEVAQARKGLAEPRLRVLRPIEDKTPEEQAVLDRLRRANGKKEDDK